MAKTMLHYSDGFPRGLVGPVDIIWQTSNEPKEERTLWIRIHPSIFQDAWDVLKDAQRRISAYASKEAGPSNQGMELVGGPMQMRDLRADVDAFEIMGPRAGAVLRRVLRVCKDQNDAKSQVRSTS